MKTWMKAIVVVMAVCALSSFVFAVEAAKETTLTGTVTVAKDAAGVVTGITLTVKEDKFTVVLDDNSKKLAELDGKMAVVVGTVAEKAITVVSFKAVPEARVPAPQ